MDETLLEQTVRQDEAGRARSQEKSLEGQGPPGEAPGYELRHRLGRGAYGEVWLGVEEGTGREVAIKFFTRHEGLDFSLLKHEVGKLLQVVHERRIVQFLSVDWDADPPYYVMEYLPGGSLADRLRGEPLPVDQAVPIFREVGKALAYLHSKAVVHCDLKPGNVLLDERGEIRLGDFGQARVAEEDVSAVGTLFFMAPEQCQPGARPDVRSDVYSLGALLYTLLTGGPPHATDEASRDLRSTGTQSERLERYRKILEESPAPVKDSDLPDLDADLRKILQRCLERDPERRFQTVDQVLEALRARQRWRTQRLVLTVGGLGPLLLLLTLGGLGFWAWNETNEEARRGMVRLALDNDLATARAMAGTVDRNLAAFQRRVDREAGRETLRELLLALRGAEGDREDELRGRLQAHSNWLYDAYKDRFFYSWVVADRDAVVQARTPYDERVVGNDYPYREWFTGEEEQDPGEVAEVPPPRDATGLTRAFVSTAEGSPRMISVASPIRAPDGDGAEPPVLGVLVATVRLETFEDWLGIGDSRSQDSNCPDRFAVLINRHGQVVRHPCIGNGLGNGGLPVEPEEFANQARIAEAIKEAHEKPAGVTLEDHRDPVQGSKPYLAAVSALEDNAGWTVLVQQDPDDALEPLAELRTFVVRLASVGAVVGLLVLALLGFLLYRATRAVRS